MASSSSSKSLNVEEKVDQSVISSSLSRLGSDLASTLPRSRDVAREVGLPEPYTNDDVLSSSSTAPSPVAISAPPLTTRACSLTPDESPSDNSASLASMAISNLHTIWSALEERVSKTPFDVALEVKNLSNGLSRSYTWNEYRHEARNFAAGLLQIGLKASERVILTTQSSVEASIATLGTIGAGGVFSHLRMDCREEELIEVARHSKATVFVVHTIDAMLKMLHVPASVPGQIKAVIVLDNSVAVPPETQDFVIYNLTHVQAIGSQHLSAIDSISLNPTDIVNVQYQYSPLGKLQGVMLTHDNINFTSRALAKEMRIVEGQEDRIVAYLPLYHVACQIFEIFLPIVSGLKVFFSANPSLAFSEFLKDIKPTIFGATPATWGQIQLKLFREKSRLSHIRGGVVYKWAKSRAKSNSRKLQYGSGQTQRSLGHALANQFVLKKLKKELGLYQCRACYALLAPMDLQVLETFNGIDIAIYQTQGVAETCGFATLNGPHSWMFGSSGRALHGTQMHVHPRTNRVLYQGRNVFLGYQDDQDATEAVLDRHKWYHSSQVGLLNPDRYLLISEYLSEYVNLSTGDLVPPVPYEHALLADMPELKRALVIGDSRNYLVVFFILRMQRTRQGAGITSRLANDVIFKSREIGSKAVTVEAVSKCPLWAVRFDHALERLNTNAQLASHKIRKWVVLPSDFSVEAGELDPESREPRRAFIQRKFKPLLDTMY